MLHPATGTEQYFKHPVRAGIVERMDYYLGLSLLIRVGGEPGSDDIASQPIVRHYLEVMFFCQIMIQKNKIIIALAQPLNGHRYLIRKIAFVARKLSLKPGAPPDVVFYN